jgi:hypothetical protein
MMHQKSNADLTCSICGKARSCISLPSPAGPVRYCVACYVVEKNAGRLPAYPVILGEP